MTLLERLEAILDDELAIVKEESNGDFDYVATGDRDRLLEALTAATDHIRGNTEAYIIGACLMRIAAENLAMIEDMDPEEVVALLEKLAEENKDE